MKSVIEICDDKKANKTYLILLNFLHFKPNAHVNSLVSCYLLTMDELLESKFLPLYWVDRAERPKP